jgi:hypothetical protein
VRIPDAIGGDKPIPPEGTNAKHSGETLRRLEAEFLARQGNCFKFGNREPMMPLCRNGLAPSRVVDL